MPKRRIPGQTDLFGDKEYTRSRADDPPTSKAAAKRIMRVITDKHQRVIDIHRASKKGLTDWELEDICKDHGATYRTRRQELSNKEWFNPPYILDSGKTKRNRESDHPNTERIIWIWFEYIDPTLANPLPAPEPQPLPPTNAYYDEDGRLIHDTCGVEGCNKSAGLSIGFFPREGKLGMWYCLPHWQERRT